MGTQEMYAYVPERWMIKHAYVASDPYCDRECGWDINCYFHKFHIGCGGATIPGITRLQPGVVTPEGYGGEEVNPATGCASADVACNVLTGFQKWITGGADIFLKPCIPPQIPILGQIPCIGVIGIGAAAVIAIGLAVSRRR